MVPKNHPFHPIYFIYQKKLQSLPTKLYKKNKKIVNNWTWDKTAKLRVKNSPQSWKFYTSKLVGLMTLSMSG